MQDFEDLEPSDEELQDLENELSATSPRLDINGGYMLYEMQSERIKLLAAIIEAWSKKSNLDSIRENVEHELKLILDDQEPLMIAKLAGARSAREGISLEE